MNMPFFSAPYLRQAGGACLFNGKPKAPASLTNGKACYDATRINAGAFGLPLN
jgi:hypothetical protein